MKCHVCINLLLINSYFPQYILWLAYPHMRHGLIIISSWPMPQNNLKPHESRESKSIFLIRTWGPMNDGWQIWRRGRDDLAPLPKIVKQGGSEQKRVVAGERHFPRYLTQYHVIMCVMAPHWGVPSAQIASHIQHTPPKVSKLVNQLSKKKCWKLYINSAAYIGSRVALGHNSGL